MKDTAVSDSWPHTSRKGTPRNAMAWAGGKAPLPWLLFHIPKDIRSQKGTQMPHSDIPKQLNEDTDKLSPSWGGHEDILIVK